MPNWGARYSGGYIHRVSPGTEGKDSSCTSPIGNKSVPKIIINDIINLLFTAIIILVISNHNSFRVTFDKIAFVYFNWKIYLYFSIGNGQPQGTSNSLLILSTHHSHHPSPLHSFIPGLKPSFSANPSHLSLLFLLHDWLHWLLGLFTDTSEHMRFFIFSSSFLHLLVFGSVRWITLNDVSFRAHVKKATRIVSYRIV